MNPCADRLMQPVLADTFWGDLGMCSVDASKNFIIMYRNPLLTGYPVKREYINLAFCLPAQYILAFYANGREGIHYGYGLG